MGLFWKKSAEAPGVGAVVPEWLRVGGCGDFARGYAAQVDEVFRTNPVGQRAVRLVAGMIGTLPVYSTVNAAAAKLVTADGVLEAIAAGLLLHGNAYVQLIVDGDETPAELAVLRPDRVTLSLDGRGQPSGLIYRAAGQAVRMPLADALGRRRVAHIKALNPLDDHYGLGCLDAAIAPASVHNRASKWNRVLLENAARPSGALTYDPGDGSILSQEQFTRLRGELETMFSGAEQAGRPLLLDGGMKWQALSLSPADMDFVALKEGAARDIALAFGVPPVLVGLPGDATFANMHEAGRALIRQTVLPMGLRILSGLSAMLEQWLGPAELAIDTDGMSELADDRQKLWDAAAKADFLSDDEKRAMLGFGQGDRAMSETAILARLMAQAEARGGEWVTLRALVEEASEAGAARALGALGLDDPSARRDMDDLRELLSAWRDAKRSAGKAVVAWFVRLCCALLLIGLAVRFRVVPGLGG